MAMVESIAKRIATSLGHSMPDHGLSQQVYDKELDQPLQSMDTSSAGGSS